jgi:pteridine reductase
MKKTKNQAVLITGGAKRLGQAMALHLASQGFDIALHYYHSKQDAIKTAQLIYKKGVRCELFQADLVNEADVKNLLPIVYKAFKNLTVLINNASIFIPNEFDDQDLTLFKHHWQMNYQAPYVLSCAFKRLVKKGQIINFVDTNIAKYKSAYADYLTTKKALAELTKMSAVAWGPNIRVNGISPGMILPPVNNQKDDRQIRAQKIPLMKIGSPENILFSLDYLLKNDYVTGQILTVDGGECRV